jgi:hypothetical protein
MPPRSRASDYAKAVITQNDYISLQIANDANISKARQAVKQQIPAELTPEQSATTDELVMDDGINEATARSNIEKIGFKPAEANTILAMMRNGALRWVDLNANFPSILADIKKRFDVKLLTPTFFIEYLRQYIKELEGTVGLTSVFQPYGQAAAGGAFNNMINNVDELRQIIPDIQQIRLIQDYLANQGGRNDRGIQQLLNDLDELRRMLPTDADYRAIAGAPVVQQSREIRDILNRFQDLPSREEIATMIKGMQRTGDTDAIIRGVRDLINSAPTGGDRSGRIGRNDGSSGVRLSLDPELFQAGIDAEVKRAEAEAETEAEMAFEQQKKDAKRIDELERKANQDAQEYLQKERDRGDKQRSGEYKYQNYKNPITGVTTSILIDTTTGKPVRDLPLPTGLAKIMLDKLKPKGSVDLSSIKERSETPLGSSTVLNTATLGQMKATFRANPDFGDLLVKTTTNAPVNYNDLSLNQTQNPKKVWWQDTNIRQIFEHKFGSGIHSQSLKLKSFNSAQKIGKGLAVKETPSYREYGKYAIHMPQLEQHNLLNVKYKSLGQIPKFKPMEVSDIMKDFITDLLDRGKPNQRVYQQIPQGERKFFEEMSIGSGVWGTLGLNRTTTSDDEEENKRFEILKGEYLSGNNNHKLITELRRMVVKMISDGRIRKSQGMAFLMELSV